MSFSSRLLLVVLFFIPMGPLMALDIQGVYSSSCSRDIGVILNVDRTKVFLLNLDGNVLSIPRYDIVGIASYPLNHIPISTLEMPESQQEKVKFFRIKTKYKNSLVELVEGWPIGFSKDKISFLNSKGQEIVVERRNIWSIEEQPSRQKREFDNPIRNRYDFLHPASMAKCPKRYHGAMDGDATRIAIVPQEYLSDPVKMKRKFDEIKQQHDIVNMYVRSQQFYAIPEVYKNLVTLGFWGVFGSRYGSSVNRSNNGAPILVDEFSNGPFGYQHHILTGAAPNSFFTHEEAQTQLYYRFKVDYFHMAMFFDPTVFLVGGKYAWQEEEIKNGDFRSTEAIFIEAGLDFSYFSLMWVAVGNQMIGTKVRNSSTGNYDFLSEDIEFRRYGIGFQNHIFKTDIFYGWRTHYSGDPTEQIFNETTEQFESISVPQTRYRFDFARVNGELEFWDKYALKGSLIGKRLSVQGLLANSYAGALYLDYQINYKYLTRAMIAYEMLSSNQRETNHYMKFGVNFSIIF